MTNYDKLRMRLIAASLPLTVDPNGLRRDIRTDEAAADVAIAVFESWYHETYGVTLDEDLSGSGKVIPSGDEVRLARDYQMLNDETM